MDGDQPSFDPASVRIYNLPATERAQYLGALQRYGTGQQWDHLDIDWTGRRRDAWTPHAIERLRAVGVWQVAAAAQANVHKRPNAPVPLAGLVVEGFSDILLGEGREPTVQVLGDQDTEALLEAVFKTSETWDALAEARDQLGRCGSACFLPVLEEGCPSAEVLATANLLPLEWEQRAGWIPKVIVEQKLVQVTVIQDDGLPVLKPAWRTRAWDQTHAYAYKDVLLDDRPQGDKESTDEYQRRHLRVGEALDLAGPPVEHHAGRCPVVWIQNVRDSDSPDSSPDYDQQSTELMDRADVLQSMIVRGSIANVDPTLHIKDYVWAQRFWPTREKGYGKVIQTSEAGDAKLIEIAGPSIEMSRATLRDVILQIEHRCGIVIIDPETAGSYRSGEALSLLWRRMEQKAGRKRRSLTRAVRQIAKIWLSILAGVGVANVEIPPRVIPDPDGGEAEITEQKLGDGRWLKIDWPPYNYPTPAQLLSTAQALSIAVGSKQILSEETATSWMLGTMGKTDPARERQAIRAEHQRRVDQLDTELGAGLDDGDEPDAGDGPGKQPGATDAAAGASTVQETALNGAQVSSLLEMVGAAGTTIAPHAVELLIPLAFSVIKPESAKQMVDAQLAFIKDKPSAVAQLGGAPPPPAKPATDPAEVEARAKELAFDTGDETDDDEDETDEFT